MEVTGFKPGSAALPQNNPDAPKLAVGERLSLCGKFGVNGQGQWRELPAQEQQQTHHEFAAVGPDGKPLAPAK